ncbi:MAG: hypothetical protein OHK0039_26470 [Bacteroidia bacterium]
MKRLLSAALPVMLWLFGSTAPLSAQTLLTWKDLARVDYASQMDDALGYLVMKPVYAPQLKALDGQRVQIKGYVLPIDTQGQQYILSAFPYSNCFFCGGAGRESVLELKLADTSATYEMDEVRVFEGVLVLSEDPFGLNYYLTEARPVRESH